MISLFPQYGCWNHELFSRSTRFTGLGQPLKNLIPSVRRKLGESQTPRLFRLIHPSNLGGEFDLLHRIGRNAKLNWPSLSRGSRGVESQTLLGSIQNNSTALRLELDIGEFFRSRSAGTTTFRFHCGTKLLGVATRHARDMRRRESLELGFHERKETKSAGSTTRFYISSARPSLRLARDPHGGCRPAAGRLTASCAVSLE